MLKLCAIFRGVAQTFSTFSEKRDLSTIKFERKWEIVIGYLNKT